MKKQTKRGELESEQLEPIRPALSQEAQENQMIAMAMNLAEKQLREGTASSQVITHFLKLGSTREKIEKELLKKQELMLDAKTEALQSSKQAEELYLNAIEAMRLYAGKGSEQ